MKLEVFQMERMQSTWEKVVRYDLSESGVRPVTLRELESLGFDLDAVRDLPLGYSQSNGTTELKTLLAAQYPGATPAHLEVTNGTSEANFVLALLLTQAGDEVAFEVPNYMQLWGVPRSQGATVRTFRLAAEHGWEPDWDEFERAVTERTRFVYVSNPNNPTGAVLSDEAMRRIVERCDRVGAWLVADEVYQGAEIQRPRTRSFWGMSDRVLVTSGLSKAYGLPGLRIGWIVGPPELVEACWSQHDYITIAPNTLSDVMARTAVRPECREKLYARGRRLLQEAVAVLEEWTRGFGELVTCQPPEAGAIWFMRYHADVASAELAERIRTRQDTLVVPGSYLGLEGYLRLWMGGDPEFLREGLARVEQELTPLVPAAAKR